MAGFIFEKEMNAPAKINLDLAVSGREYDSNGVYTGYHLIESRVHAIKLCDTLQMRLKLGMEVPCGENEKIRLAIADERACGARERAEIPGDERNLVCKAARAYVEKQGGFAGLDWSLDIELTKRIPSGAGLGGGSTDAAAVLAFLWEASRKLACGEMMYCEPAGVEISDAGISGKSEDVHPGDAMNLTGSCGERSYGSSQFDGISLAAPQGTVQSEKISAQPDILRGSRFNETLPAAPPRPRLTCSELVSLAASVGSDVPMFLEMRRNRAASVNIKGRGEIVVPAAASKFFAVLVKPPVEISAGEIYRALDEDRRAETESTGGGINSAAQRSPKSGASYGAGAEKKHPLVGKSPQSRLSKIHVHVQDKNEPKFEEKCTRNRTNDLEKIAISRYSIIREVIDFLQTASAQKAEQIMMSGSGPTVFALFDTREDAQDCYERVVPFCEEVILTEGCRDSRREFSNVE